jgi:hypothetical protein
MLLGFLTLLIMLAVAYAYVREGLFTAFLMGGNVLVAGLVAFNFWEPLADLTEPLLKGTFLLGFEDAFWLMLLFCFTLGMMRLMANNLAPTDLPFPVLLQRGGGIFFGLVTGYLVAGFLVCLLQTLPWHQNFMFFESKYDRGTEHVLRRWMPPDRVWLALMHRGGAYAFANQVDAAATNPQSPFERYLTFDWQGSFELRYARHRRYSDSPDTPLKYQGEFDQELDRR